MERGKSPTAVAGDPLRGRGAAPPFMSHCAGGIGVAEEHAYHVKKIESDYFEEAWIACPLFLHVDPVKILTSPHPEWSR